MTPRLLISPPFGNYVTVSGGTSVFGSYTACRRTGLVRQAIKTIRPVEGGWVNKIGLRNPGVTNISYNRTGIYSLAPMRMEDYDVFYDTVPPDVAIELNLSCPNVDGPHVIGELRRFVDRHPLVICKLSPTGPGKTHMGLAYRMGVRHFHMCNTIPTDAGGVSGYQLKERSLELIRWTRRNMPSDIQIIGGGGIYTPNDVQEYRAALVDGVSLSSIYFTPWKVPAVVRAIRAAWLD